MDSDILDLSFLNHIDPIPLLEDKGVIKYIIKPGDPLNVGQKLPQKGNKAYIKLEGRKIDGSSLDKNKNPNGEIRKINLFSDKYIEGIHISVASMCKNELAWFKIEPKYHFFGSGDVSYMDESNSVNKTDPLLYKIELIDYKSVNLDPMDFEGRIEKFEESREKGKELFTNGKFNESFETYMKSIHLIRNFPNNLKEILNEFQKGQLKYFSNILYSNAALCKIKLKSWYEAKNLCDEGLKTTPLDVKLLYRKAQCHMGIHEFHQAIDYFDKVIELDPSNSDAEEQKKQCKIKEIYEKEKEKKKYIKILEKMPEEEKKETLEKKKKEVLIEIDQNEDEVENADDHIKKGITLDDLEKGIIIDANDPNNIFRAEKEPEFEENKN